MLTGQPLEEKEIFTYLGSTVDKREGTVAYVKIRIGKARAVFLQLKKVWASRNLSKKNIIRLFNSNVKPVLLYESESRGTKEKIQAFINTCFRRILQIHWPETIRNKKLWQRTRQKPVAVELQQCRWRRIRHTLRKMPTSITRQAPKKKEA